MQPGPTHRIGSLGGLAASESTRSSRLITPGSDKSLPSPPRRDSRSNLDSHIADRMHMLQPLSCPAWSGKSTTRGPRPPEYPRSMRRGAITQPRSPPSRYPRDQDSGSRLRLRHRPRRHHPRGCCANTGRITSGWALSPRSPESGGASTQPCRLPLFAGRRLPGASPHGRGTRDRRAGWDGRAAASRRCGGRKGRCRRCAARPVSGWSNRSCGRRVHSAGRSLRA